MPKKSGTTGEFFFTFTVMFICLIFLVESISLGIRAAFAPMLMSAAATVLLAIQAGLLLAGRKDAAAKEIQAESGVTLRFFQITGWILSVTLTAPLLGLQYTLPFLVFIFFVWIVKERIWFALIFSLGTYGVIWVIARLMGLQVTDGWLFKLLA
jgi:hypothetical protein